MKKYKVTQEFMDALDDWSDKWVDGRFPVNALTSETIKNVVERWRLRYIENGEPTKRLGALLNWVNGEDVFEVGTPSYVVRLKDDIKYGKVYIITTTNGYVGVTYYMEDATRFDDFNKASEWANKHFEVVEVDE